MFSLLKKAVIAVAFVITFAVAASPVNYLAEDSDVYAYVNVTSLLKAKSLQQFIPMIEKDLQDTGVKVSDFDGELAIGANLDSADKNIQCNLDLIFALKNAAVKKLFDTLKKTDNGLKPTDIAGKPALEDKDGRIIIQEPNIFIIQFHAEGTKPFATLNNKGNNPLKQVASQIQKFDVVIYVDVEKVFKKTQHMIPAEDKDAIDIFNKIKAATLFVKIMPNENYYINVSVECKSVNEAEVLDAYVKIFLDAASKDEASKSLVKKIKSKRTGARISFDVFLDNNDINMLQQLAE